MWSRPMLKQSYRKVPQLTIIVEVKCSANILRFLGMLALSQWLTLLQWLLAVWADGSDTTRMDGRRHSLLGYHKPLNFSFPLSSPLHSLQLRSTPQLGNSLLRLRLGIFSLLEFFQKLEKKKEQTAGKNSCDTRRKSVRTKKKYPRIFQCYLVSKGTNEAKRFVLVEPLLKRRLPPKTWVGTNNCYLFLPSLRKHSPIHTIRRCAAISKRTWFEHAWIRKKYCKALRSARPIVNCC